MSSSPIYRRPCTMARKTPVPIFLCKTLDMIETCDEDIAGWSEDGLHFIIRDPEKLASLVFPFYFKHTNFCSFVRQLHFYGFRKMKDDSSIDPTNHNMATKTTKIWRFMHPKFQRGGGADQLKYIRRNGSQFSDFEDIPIHVLEELESMKSNIESLKSKVVHLSYEIEEMRSILQRQKKSNLAPCSCQESERLLPSVTSDDNFLSITPTHDIFKNDNNEVLQSPVLSCAEVSLISERFAIPNEENKKISELSLAGLNEEECCVDTARVDSDEDLLTEAAKCFLPEVGMDTTLPSQVEPNADLTQVSDIDVAPRKRLKMCKSSIIHVPPVPSPNMSSYVSEPFPVIGRTSFETRYFKPIMGENQYIP